jgi:hypothetical protein
MRQQQQAQKEGRQPKNEGSQGASVHVEAVTYHYPGRRQSPMLPAAIAWYQPDATLS